MVVSSHRGFGGRLARRGTQWAVLLVALTMVMGAMLLVRWLQARTEVITVYVGDVPLVVEVADNPALRSRGLKYRQALAADAGMLFVYPEAGMLRFWMKDTRIDLDIGFFDDQARLIEIREMAALDQQSHYLSSKPAKYALEVNRGWFSSNRIPADALLRLPSSVGAR